MMAFQEETPAAAPPCPLTTRQHRALDAIAAALVAGAPLSTIAALCAAAGLSRATYFRWSRHPAFHAALTRLLCERDYVCLVTRVTLEQARGLGVARGPAPVNPDFAAFRRTFDFTFDCRSLALHAAMSLSPAVGAPHFAPTLLARHARRQLDRYPAANPRPRSKPSRPVASAVLKTQNLPAENETIRNSRPPLPLTRPCRPAKPSSRPIRRRFASRRADARTKQLIRARPVSRLRSRSSP